MSLDLYSEQGAQTRLALEDVYGVLNGTPDWVRLNGLSMMLTPEVVINPFQPKGAMVPTAPRVDDKFTRGSYNGSVDFNGLTYPLYGLLGFPTYTNLGGSPAAHSRVWTWNGRRPNRAASFSGHYGYPDSAEEALGIIFNTMSLSGGRPDGFEVSGDLFGKVMTAGNLMGGITLERQTITPSGTVSGGTWTFEFEGQVTGNINHNANAATIQTAIEALPNVEPGDVIVAGGPLSSGAVTIDFTGSFAGVNVPIGVVEDANITGGGTLAIAQTTAGADAAVDIDAILAGAIHGNAFLDSSWANLGNTSLGYCLGMSASIGERLSRVTPVNKAQTTDARIDVGQQEHNLMLTLARNAVADAQLAKLYAGTWSFPRIEWEGDTISGSNEYLLRIEAAVFYDGISDPGATQNALTREYSGRIGIDPVSANCLKVTLINTLAGLDGS